MADEGGEPLALVRLQAFGKPTKAFTIVEERAPLRCCFAQHHALELHVERRLRMAQQHRRPRGARRDESYERAEIFRALGREHRSVAKVGAHDDVAVRAGELALHEILERRTVTRIEATFGMRDSNFEQTTDA